MFTYFCLLFSNRQILWPSSLSPLPSILIHTPVPSHQIVSTQIVYPSHPIRFHENSEKFCADALCIHSQITPTIASTNHNYLMNIAQSQKQTRDFWTFFRLVLLSTHNDPSTQLPSAPSSLSLVPSLPLLPSSTFSIKGFALDPKCLPTLRYTMPGLHQSSLKRINFIKNVLIQDNIIYRYV